MRTCGARHEVAFRNPLSPTTWKNDVVEEVAAQSLLPNNLPSCC